jgi:hypothetical protein
MPSVLQQLEYEIPEITVEDLPAPPPVMVEPNDMQIVASPCHGYEPIKVPDGRVDLSTVWYVESSSPCSSSSRSLLAART